MSKYINLDEAKARTTQLYHGYEVEQWLDTIPSVDIDRPQGFWTKTDVATYRCSECGKKQIADDINELNFCCCCGSRNKVRRKGVDDE